MITHAHDTQLVARPGRVAGIQIEDLATQVEGMKSGETRTINVKAPATHASEALRGKDVQIEVGLKDIKALELAEINEDFLESLGFADEKELREALREQMVERITYDVQQAMREQEGLKAELVWEIWVPATEIEPDHPVVRALKGAALTVLGHDVPLMAFPGATDAAPIQLIAGIPTVAAFGPGLLPAAHSPNESLAVSGILKAAQIYALAALAFTSTP